MTQLKSIIFKDPRFNKNNFLATALKQKALTSIFPNMPQIKILSEDELENDSSLHDDTCDKTALINLKKYCSKCHAANPDPELNFIRKIDPLTCYKIRSEPWHTKIKVRLDVGNGATETFMPPAGELQPSIEERQAMIRVLN